MSPPNRHPLPEQAGDPARSPGRPARAGIDQCLCDNLAEAVRSPDKVWRRTLVWIGCQKYLAEGSPERIDPSREIHLREKMELPIIQAHLVLLVEKYESCIEGSMVGWRKGDAVSHLVGASWCPNRQDVRCIHEPKLDPRDRTTISVSK